MKRGAKALKGALLWGCGPVAGSLTGALGGEGDTPLPPGGSFMVSLLIPKKQLPVAASGDAMGPGISAPSHSKLGGPFPSDPMAPCRVLHQQDLFEDL